MNTERKSSGKKGHWDFLPGLFLAIICIGGIFGLLAYLIKFLENI